MAAGATGRRMKLGTMPSLKEDSLNGGKPSYRDIQAMAQASEAAGFDSFWLADHVVFRHQPLQRAAEGGGDAGLEPHMRRHRAAQLGDGAHFLDRRA